MCVMARRAIIALGMMRARVRRTRSPEKARSHGERTRQDRARSLTVAPLLRVALLMIVVLAWGPGAYALDPALDVSQYAHTAWKVRDGFAKSGIISIAQTPDGFLWLGTGGGLLRFDGVRVAPWQAPAGQQLPSTFILTLFAARDGTLWIGTTKGLASWRGGKLTQYPELAGQTFTSLLEDREGTVWAGGLSVPARTGRLCAIHNGSVECSGEDGALGHGVFNLYEDSKGNLWVGMANGVWRWKPGPPKFYPLPAGPNGIGGLAEDDDGALLVGVADGIRRFVDGKAKAYPLPPGLGQFEVRRLLHDRDGGLWIGTYNNGLLHVHNGRVDLFAQSDSLSDDHTSAFLEDREGNIWLGTLGGLDRFRNFAVPTMSMKQGLPNTLVVSVLADRDGSVWLATYSGLSRWDSGQLNAFGKQGGKLNGQNANSLFQDGGGRIWVSTNREFGYLENDKFISINGVPGGAIHAITEDSDGNLWIANEAAGLLKLFHGQMVQQIPWAELGHKEFATALLADPLRGGVWVGFYLGGVIYFRDKKVRGYTADDGLGEGRVTGFRLDPDGTLWASTEGGLSRLKNGRGATLTSKNGLPCDKVHWAIEDDARSFWLLMDCGLVRVARAELDAWAGAVDKGGGSKQTIQATTFDNSDGVRANPVASSYSPQVTKSSDGKLWFLPLDGVSIIDPRHLPFNRLPPPVHVEQITADHKTCDVANGDGKGRLRLPPLVRDLQIDYTALSLVAPEKVRFRYKLEGWDRDWQDVGNRRQAFYTNLSPRKYRFRVMACNNSGVWNEEGALLDFSVAPAYYQTIWFRSLCVAAFLALLWGLYQFRLHQLQQRFNAGLEARVNERTRIARELHDTLLQSFHGLLLKFQATAYLLPKHPEEALKTLESTIDQAMAAITEGRDAVQGLRSSTTVTNDLACAITTLGTELAGSESNPNAAEFHVEVEGTPRDLHPILRDEVYRIAGEALRNAFKHAEAKRIEVEIRYDERQLRLRVRDDGKGIDAKHLNEDGRPGHFGLRGMRERAKLMGGKLAVWSELDSGTEVELRIPASRAYETSRVRRRWWLAEKLSGKDTEMKS
jgi:signal transduction histidine kinase/ligand-binding sensor domain-containing protein